MNVRPYMDPFKLTERRQSGNITFYTGDAWIQLESRGWPLPYYRGGFHMDKTSAAIDVGIAVCALLCFIAIAERLVRHREGRKV